MMEMFIQRYFTLRCIKESGDIRSIVIVYRVGILMNSAFFNTTLDKSCQFWYGRVDECLQGQPPDRTGKRS
jgi:hypothetical protein